MLLAWFLIPYGVFSLAATKMPSYVAIAWPAIFPIYADAWCSFFDLVHNRRSFVRALAITCILVLSAGMVLQVRRTLVQMNKFTRKSNPVWAQQLRKMAEGGRANKLTMMVNTNYPIEAMFYADLTAYSQVPSAAELHDLQNRGYEIIAVDNGRLPAHISQNPSVKKIAQPPDALRFEQNLGQSVVFGPP